MNSQNEEVADVESTKKPPTRKPSWLGAVYESAYDSTTHGLPHIFKREHLMLRLFWIFCFFCSAGVCSYMIARSIIEYFKFETVTKTDSIFEIPTLFPTVSICNQNAFVTDQSFDYVKEIFRANNITDIEKTLVNASALGLIGLKYIVGVIMRDPIFSDEERKNTGFNISRMLLSCTYNNYPCTSKEFSWYYDSYYGNCFSFNSGKFLNGSLAPDKYSTKAGSINGLSFELFIPEPTNVYALSFVNGIHITVHNRSVRPIFFNGFNANVGTFTYVALNREFTSLLEHPYSECIKEIQSYAKRSIYVKALLDANITYSQNDCFNVCLQDRIVRDCHCYILEFPYWDSSSSTPCRSLKELSCFGGIFNDFFNDDLNEACPDACPLECDSSKFLISSSSLDFPSKVYANILKEDWRIQARFNNRKNVSQDELKRSLLGINIFYDDLSYKRYSQLEKWLIIDLISNIGGTLGLFLGMSFLSFVELIDLIFQLLFKSCGKGKREKIYPSDSNE